jgi:hypothetical protein
VPATLTESDLLATYVRLHNRGVTESDFSEMLELFSDNAVLKFEGAVEMVFEGKQAITNAFRRMPPTSQIYTKEPTEKPNGTEAPYGCCTKPSQIEGVIGITSKSGLITTLTVWMQASNT